MWVLLGSCMYGEIFAYPTYLEQIFEYFGSGRSVRGPTGRNPLADATQCNTQRQSLETLSCTEGVLLHVSWEVPRPGAHLPPTTACLVAGVPADQSQPCVDPQAAAVLKVAQGGGGGLQNSWRLSDAAFALLVGTHRGAVGPETGCRA